jgi:methionyl-tRNA synthetase
MPSTAASIVEQLEAPLLSIPDKWSGDALKGGHKIGKVAYLFQKIDDKKEKEWKEKYGGTQASRLAEEEAKAKKADKEKGKERKGAKKAAGGLDNGGKKEEKTKEKTEEKIKEKIEEKTEIPLRGQVAEEQAPAPAAAP